VCTSSGWFKALSHSIHLLVPPFSPSAFLKCHIQLLLEGAAAAAAAATAEQPPPCSSMPLPPLSPPLLLLVLLLYLQAPPFSRHCGN
jgi:hypothetical protein